MKNKLPKIVIYEMNNKIIKDLDSGWIEKNNSKLLNFVQFYKNDDKNNLKEPYLRISSYPHVIIRRNFSLSELNVKDDEVVIGNGLVRKTKDYDVVGLGHIKYLGEGKYFFWGENPNEEHFRKVFSGCEIDEKNEYGDKAFVLKGGIF